MLDGIAEVIIKPEFLEVSHTDFYSHISLIYNIISEEKLKILADLTILQIQKPMPVR